MYGYKFGYELLMPNGPMTFAGSLMTPNREKETNTT